ncbi:hypothetical protein CL653_02455 [bacterium]|nr:hypothetical protein [bacterium]
MEEKIKKLEKELFDQAEKVTREVERGIGGYRKTVFERFPFLMIGLSTFGLVCVLYSFEKFIDSIPFLADRPLYIFLLGLIAMTITGTIYKRLQ